MKKRLIAIVLCLCFVLVGCDKITEAFNKNNFKEVTISGSKYLQITAYMNEDEYSYFEFEPIWLEDVATIEPSNEHRFISINGSQNHFIDCESIEYNSLRHGKLLDYEQYKELCEKYSMNQDYDDAKKNYIVVMDANPNYEIIFTPVDIVYDEEVDVINYYYHENQDYQVGEKRGYICVVPTDLNVDTEINMQYCYEKGFLDEMEALLENEPLVSHSYVDEPVANMKPVIYLYPNEDNTSIDVSLELSDATLTCTYPSYEDGWSVVANKDGTINLNGKEYNYLYWEGNYFKSYSFEEGFCVKGSDTAAFLEVKLAELGLNRREANEFIVFWLPHMEVNEYNVISFDTKQYEEAFKLNVNPAPDTIIRVFMTWYGTDEEIEVTPQIIETPSREGFTVVEWGGAKIK